jgi:CubicO group peptidase (beta-lactamase class C family)
VLLAAAPSGLADQVDDYLRAEMDKRHIPGLAMTVVRGDKQIRTSALGLANIELQVPVTLQTRFEIGSLTKQFTAAAILLLAQESKLSVEDRINRRLAGTPADWSNITIRHLLTHTSGIRSYTGLRGFELTRQLTQEQFIAAIGAYPLEFSPGDAWKYSNSGYNLLGYIIENVSETNYWAFMAQRIFRPLGMEATSDRRPNQVMPNRAAGYERTNQTFVNRDYDLTDVFSAGALVSTVGDLARWDAALNREKLLSAASKELMWTAARLNDGQATTYGMGWSVEAFNGHRNIGHNGSTSGFSASNQRFPDDDLAVIVLTNTDEKVAGALAHGIARFYLSAQGGSRP